MAKKTIRFGSLAPILALVVPAVTAGCSSTVVSDKNSSGSHIGDAAAGGGSAGGAANGGASTGGKITGGMGGSGTGGANAGGANGGRANAGGANAGGANAGGASTGGGANTACTTDADCQILSDYCTGCDCRSLGAKESLPKCSGPGVNCFADPCRGMVAACVQGGCVAKAAPSGTCATSGQSCAQGEACCGGLMCCTGVPVPAGNEYCSATCPRSDRNIKEGFRSVDRSEILGRVAKLPISEWSYMTEGARVTHLGPMAQDFKAAFGFGDSDKTILQVDADGVALVAIQELNARMEQLAAENRALRARVDELGGAACRER
jgi:hypothetical protein